MGWLMMHQKKKSFLMRKKWPAVLSSTGSQVEQQQRHKERQTDKETQTHKSRERERRNTYKTQEKKQKTHTEKTEEETIWMQV